MSLIEAKAHSVLFPVLEQLELNEPLRRFLCNGGRSLLIAEAGEAQQHWQRIAGEAKSLAGPLIVASCEADVAVRSQGLSLDVIALLHHEMGLQGVVMSVDLAQHRVNEGVSPGEVAVAALNAGADLLLLSAKAVPYIPAIVAAIMTAIARGTLAPERLDAASLAVWKLARRLY
ncbi:MAG: glycoside hydrolase, family 3-like protein [Pseudomonas sp.]|nr:glycoside hydrolase, family 3-like protein [Pseudomonas sp.]